MVRENKSRRDDHDFSCFFTIMKRYFFLTTAIKSNIKYTTYKDATPPYIKYMNDPSVLKNRANFN